MFRWPLRPAAFALTGLVALCCAGGGCAGGSTAKPLPKGFPPSGAVLNAGSVRLTRSGLDALSNRAGSLGSALFGGGTLDVPIASASAGVSVFAFDFCTSPGPGQCAANVDLRDVELNADAVSPNRLTLTGTVPVEVADLPVTVALSLGFFQIGIGLDVGVGAGGCQGGTPQVAPTLVPFTVGLPLVAETQPPRAGYTRVDTAPADVQVTTNLDPNAIQICGAGLSGPFAGIVGAFKSLVPGLLQAPLESLLRSQIARAFCQRPDPTADPPCPAGASASPDGTACLFSAGPESGQCLPVLLGTQGRLDLGGLLSTLSPRTTGGVDFVLAAGGTASTSPDCPPGSAWTSGSGCVADPHPPYPGHTPNGITLGLVGGALPDPQASCAPVAQNAVPQGIPIPDALMTDAVTGWPAGDAGPDIGFAVSGRFLQYAAVSVYGSGALCLGLSTDQLGALSTGYLSAILPSLKDLTFEPGPGSLPSAVAVTTRPLRPPTVSIGGGTDIRSDPLLTIGLPEFAVDFYVWSYDRYVRVFTYTADLSIPVDLQTGKDPKTNPNGGILPVLGDVSAAHATVSDSQLLLEDPQTISEGVTALLSGLVGKLLGKSVAPLDPSGALATYGLALSLPNEAFHKVTKGSDDFVSVFGDLVPSPGATGMTVHPRASLTGLRVDPPALSLASADPTRFPTIAISLSAPEDDGTRPIEYSWWIDDQPHAAWTTQRESVVKGQYLFLQGKHILHATARVVGHPQTEATAPAEVPFVLDAIAPTVWIERTAGGYLGRAFDYVSDVSALRARYRATDGSGATATWTTWAPLSALGAIEAQGLEVQVVDESGNVGAARVEALLPPDSSAQPAPSSRGCSASGASPDGAAGLAAAAAGLAAALFARRRRVSAMVFGSAGVFAVAAPGCSCGSQEGATKTGCGVDCDQACGPPNRQGLIGSYTSVATASDGTIWVAGYNDADVTSGLLYGDLVVGTFDAASGHVAWQTVDGLPSPPPAGSCPPNAANTWRRGLTDPGPDVGLWTSVQLDATGDPMVSYYDATHQSLKFASSADGGRTWASHTVMQAASSDIGRYSKMLVVGGVPTIAFLVIEPGGGGWARSRVVLATGSVSHPQSGADWMFQDALASDQTPCRPEFCGGAGTATIDAYPDAVGDYVSLASGPQGLGLVAYDRTRGELVGAVSRGGAYGSAVLDGNTGGSDPAWVAAGGVGIGASLAIAPSGDWHVSYVNAWTRALQYLEVPGGDPTRPLAPEVVDDGLEVDGQPFPDAPHLVGDDSSITVDDEGTVRVVYQDATAGTLREALGSPAGNRHVWTRRAIVQPSAFGGFFPHYVAAAQRIEHWFRATDTTAGDPSVPGLVHGDVAFVPP